jgi:small GTP-binding protein
MEINQAESYEKKDQNKNHSENNFINEGVEFELKGKKIQILKQENAENMKYNLAFKVIVIGNSYVGKSSLVNSALKNRFVDGYSSTIGFDYCSFYVKINNDVIKLQIWDTCGQEIYQSLISNFYRNSSLAIMVYAINDKASFENLDIWLKDLKKDASPDIKTILIGNKCDLESERKIKKFVAETYAKDFGFLNFFETSAKTGFNSQKVFINSALILYEDYKQYEKQGRIGYDQNEEQSSTQLSKKKKVQKTGSCC